jgi:hypothetical protein
MTKEWLSEDAFSRNPHLRLPNKAGKADKRHSPLPGFTKQYDSSNLFINTIGGL